MTLSEAVPLAKPQQHMEKDSHCHPPGCLFFWGGGGGGAPQLFLTAGVGKMEREGVSLHAWTLALHLSHSRSQEQFLCPH